MTEAGEKDSLKAFSPESGLKNNSMLEKRKEWVLGAIELLRQRKARPDLPNLCSTLRRKHGLDKSEIQPVIDQLVQEKAVKKVFFKGQLSYRSTKSSSDGQKSPLSTSNRIIHCIRMITKHTGDGVSFRDVECWLISRNPETKLVKNRLEAALKKELEANTITKLPDNCYVLTESLPTKEKKEETPVLPTRVTPPSKRASPVENGPDSATKRPGRPRRKLSLEGNKYSEDPDYEVPQSYRNKRSERALCDFCRKPADNRDKKKFLLICKDCNAKAHPSCMNYSEELAAKARNSPWQCIDCKVCFVCNEAGDDNQLLFCDSCDKGYHMTCHNPPLSNQPKGKWVCGRCKLEKKSPPASKDTSLTVVASPCNKKDTAQSSMTTDLTDKDPKEIDFSVSRRGRKRKLKEDFGDFIGFGTRRPSLNQTGTTNSSLNQSATTVSSLDQSANDRTCNQSTTGTFNRPSLNLTGTTNSSLNQSATTVSSLDQSANDRTCNQSPTGTFNRPSLNQTGTTNSSLNQSATTVSSLDQSANDRSCNQSPTGTFSRPSLNLTGTTNSSLNQSATTVSSLDQSANDRTCNQSPTGTFNRPSLNQTGTTNSSLNQSATTVSSLDQSANDRTCNQSPTGTFNRPSLNQTGTTNSSLNQLATTVSSLDQSANNRACNQSPTANILNRSSLNQTGTTNSSLNQSATAVSSLDQSANDRACNQSPTGTFNRPSLNQTGTTNSSLNQLATTVSSLDQSANDRACNQSPTGTFNRPSLNQTGTTNSSLNQLATTVSSLDQSANDRACNQSPTGTFNRPSLNQTGTTDSSLNQSATAVSSLDQFANDRTCNQSPTEGTEGATCLPTPGASPNHHSDTFDYQLKMSESEIPLHITDTSTYPNASKWTTEEVVDYFTDLGFSNEAKAFKDQEIDGRSLLLMKRNDVLTGLAIKLGPALKIYQKIYKLQTVGQISSS